MLGGLEHRPLNTLIRRGPLPVNGSGGPRMFNGKVAEIVSVKAFLNDNGSRVALDNVQDDTTGYQRAITAVQGTRVALYHPDGTGKITAELTATAALKLIGVSREISALQLTSTTQNGIVVNCDAGCHFEGFRIIAAAAASAGSAILINGGATHNLFSTFRDMQFSNCWNGIATVNAADWTVANCYFAEYKNFGILVDNQFDEDAGDSYIGEGSVFSTTQVNAEAIHQSSSGGLKVVGSKLLGGAYGYRGVISAAAQTSQLHFTGCSIENQTIAGIAMSRAGVGAQFSNVSIVGGNLAGQPSPILFNDANAGWLSDIVISAVNIDIAAAGGTAVTITAASGYNINACTLTSQGGTTTGIAIGAAAGNGDIGINNYNGLTTNISNGSASCMGPPPRMLKTSAAAVSCPVDATEDTLATITIPAQQMGKNGSIEVDATFVYTSSANNKTMRVKFGGTNFKAVVVTATDTCRLLCTVHNQNATNAQVGSAPAAVASDVGSNAGVLPTAAVDTTADVTLLITGQKATAGETLTLSRYTVKLLPSLS